MKKAIITLSITATLIAASTYLYQGHQAIYELESKINQQRLANHELGQKIEENQLNIKHYKDSVNPNQSSLANYLSSMATSFEKSLKEYPSHLFLVDGDIKYDVYLDDNGYSISTVNEGVEGENTYYKMSDVSELGYEISDYDQIVYVDDVPYIYSKALNRTNEIEYQYDALRESDAFIDTTKSEKFFVNVVDTNLPLCYLVVETDGEYLRTNYPYGNYCISLTFKADSTELVSASLEHGDYNGGPGRPSSMEYIMLDNGKIKYIPESSIVGYEIIDTLPSEIAFARDEAIEHLKRKWITRRLPEEVLNYIQGKTYIDTTSTISMEEKMGYPFEADNQKPKIELKDDYILYCLPHTDAFHQQYYILESYEFIEDGLIMNISPFSDYYSKTLKQMELVFKDGSLSITKISKSGERETSINKEYIHDEE